MDIETISREDLKQKIDRGDDFKLVMALHEWAYKAKHIPGSLNFPTVEDAMNALDKDDEIVVYCSNVACVGSQYAYRSLVEAGYTNVRRYAGGLTDWDDAGYPFEGSDA